MPNDTYFCCIVKTHTATAQVTEKCGVAHRILPPGLACINPCACEKVVADCDLRAKLMKIVSEVKTKDDALVNITTHLVTRVVDFQTMFYTLKRPGKQKKAYVEDALRSKCATLTVDEIFLAKTEMADAMRRNLQEDLQPYGIKVVSLLLTDVVVSKKLHKAMAKKEVAKRDVFTTAMLADAKKIKIVKQAEAEADAEALAGSGTARERKALLDGVRGSIASFHMENPSVSPQECYDTVLLIQYLQALGKMNGGEIPEKLVLPCGPKSVQQLWENIDEQRELALSREYHISLKDSDICVGAAPGEADSEIHLDDKTPLLIEEVPEE